MINCRPNLLSLTQIRKYPHRNKTRDKSHGKIDLQSAQPRILQT